VETAGNSGGLGGGPAARGGRGVWARSEDGGIGDLGASEGEIAAETAREVESGDCGAVVGWEGEESRG
jgi:hypothetical protein